jgi:hypothetical protein
MNKKVLILSLSLFLSCGLMHAQEAQMSELQQRAETSLKEKKTADARYHFIRAYEDYMNKGNCQAGTECGVKAVALYYKENYYKEAFDLLSRIEQNIKGDPSAKAAMFYLTSKERYEMYMRMKRSASALEHLKAMENHANASGKDELKNDVLYNKAIYYYSFGQTAQGNAVFKEMASKLTNSKEYDKVDQAYKTLIANGRKSGNANLVANSYSNYIAWKDSAIAMKHADDIKALENKITDLNTTIEDKDSSLTTRQAAIVGLSILAAALAAALVLGALVLMRFVLLTRKQKKQIDLANDSNALKAKFISNISAQMNPTLQKFDQSKPEVKALMDFNSHIQQLSDLENSDAEEMEFEEIRIPEFCEELMEEIRNKVISDVNLTVNAPKMSANFYKPYVSHILSHLLRNAAIYTPAEGTVTLEFKKRGAHSYQFLVANTGEPIPEEKREDVFKPFLEIKDLTEGDGLGLPICKQMALKMKGDLEIDPKFTKGTRFILDLHS